MPPHSTSHSSHSSFHSSGGGMHGGFSGGFGFGSGRAPSGGSSSRGSGPSSSGGMHGGFVGGNRRSGFGGGFGGPMPYRPRHPRPPMIHMMPIYMGPIGTTGSSRSTRATEDIRPRTNQPEGYSESLPNYQAPSFYHCLRHDYMYYPVGWYDTRTGEYRAPGYYDENGAYYPGAVIRMTDADEAAVYCKDCNAVVQPYSEEESLWRCSSCQRIIPGVVEDTEYSAAPTGTSSDSAWVFKAVKWLIIFIVVVGLYATASNVIRGFSGSDQASYAVTDQSDEYYVEAIGRTCPWMDEYSSYYDATTDCYFRYNQEVSPAQWQYWYEGISSDYGDYGWMEYDEEKGAWFIEDRNSHWIQLPSSYDTAQLWHISSGK